MALLFTGLELIAQPDPRKKRILFVVDGSSSMTYSWNTDTRFKAAGTIIAAIMDSALKKDPNIQFGLRVFGHQYPAKDKVCNDTRLEVPFNPYNASQVKVRMANINPQGSSPIAYSLRECAENDLVQSNMYSYGIILLTDGQESCDGDICNTITKYLSDKFFFKPYIIGLMPDPKLASYYDCAGEYLQVLTKGDIPNAVNKIMSFKTYEKPVPKTAVVNTPPQPALPDRIVITRVDALKRYQLRIITPPPPRTPRQVTVPKLKLPNVDQLIAADAPPVTLKKVEVVKANPKTRLWMPATPRWTGENPTVRPLAKLKQPDYDKLIAAEIPPVVLKKEELVTVRPKNKLYYRPVSNIPLKAPRLISFESNKTTSTIDKLLREEQATPTPVAPKPTPPVASKPPVTVPPKDSVAVEAPKPKPAIPPGTIIKPATTAKPVQMSVRNAPTGKPSQMTPDKITQIEEPNKENETRVQVYFRNKLGKFYRTSPVVVLKDPKTQQSKFSFGRQVDESGEPVPFKLPAGGTFDVTIMGRTGLVLRNREIKTGTTNKIYITVDDASLQFSNATTPNKAMKDYVASVRRIFPEGGPMYSQNLGEKKYYDPGNYHIEINTMPPLVFNVDITFGDISDILIPEPGLLQIENTNFVGQVRLFKPLGDAFVVFTSMNIDGNAPNQKLKLQPGVYKAEFNPTPGKPNPKPDVITFMIVSNTTTNFELPTR
jgi:hypothetical protein